MPASRPSSCLKIVVVVATLTLLLAGCTPSSDETGVATSAGALETVTITDNHGEVEVPFKPERVVALDNTTFQTLSDWGVELVAAPKPLMEDVWPDLSGGEEVLDVGLHREPDLEAVIAAEPDLIIGGYRFVDHYSELRTIQPATIEISPRENEDFTSELRRQISILGQIFDKEAEAEATIAELDGAIADAKSAYNGTDTVMGLITSGGVISHSAPGDGRGIGTLFPALDLVPALDQEAVDESKVDDISVEALASGNPDWMIVLDRNATEEGAARAADLIAGSEALQNVTAVQKNQIVYL